VPRQIQVASLILAHLFFDVFGYYKFLWISAKDNPAAISILKRIGQNVHVYRGKLRFNQKQFFGEDTCFLNSSVL